MELDTVEIREGLTFVAEVLDECYFPGPYTTVPNKQGYRTAWNECQLQCPNCDSWNTIYLIHQGNYCKDCCLLWRWNVLR